MNQVKKPGLEPNKSLDELVAGLGDPEWGKFLEERCMDHGVGVYTDEHGIRRCVNCSGEVKDEKAGD